MASARDVLLSRIVDDVAANGIGDRSLRDLAAAVGTSHRLLIYHFGSRAGLVAAIVAEVEATQRALFVALAESATSPAELVRALWRQVSDVRVRSLVRLFFEALAYPVEGGGSELTGAWLAESDRIATGMGVEFDPVAVRLGVAVVRGLLIDVLATGDTTAADAALERFLAMWVPEPVSRDRAGSGRRAVPRSPRRQGGTARRSSP